jgi:hypothetical protein
MNSTLAESGHYPVMAGWKRWRNGIGEAVSTAECMEEMETTSLTAAMAYQVKPTRENALNGLGKVVVEQT